MAYNARQEEIARILTLMKRVSVSTLTRRLNVSEATIRKDLTQLEEQAFLIRTHGGAIIAEKRREVRGAIERERSFVAEKTAIARLAASMLVAGETVFVDSGSTCALIAREIREMNLRVVCHSVGVINELINSPSISLHMLGGSYRTDSGSFIGPISEENVRGFHFDVCFVGTAGISRDGVFTSENLIEARLKTEVLKVAQRRIMVADHSKFDHQEFAVFGRAADVDLLITDELLVEVDVLESLGLEVLRAPLAEPSHG